MVKEYGYEYDVELDEELYKKTKGKVTHERFMGAVCLRTGRDAIKAVAREFDSSTALLPALACESMALPFEMFDHTVKYYKLNNDYSVNLESLNSLIKDKDKTYLFIYMDYFGNRAISETELNMLKKEYQSLVFIEDRTHTLIVEKKTSFAPDFVVASLRKWVDIPDGGLLWTDRKLRHDEFNDNLVFSETRLKAQCMRKNYLETGDERLKAEYRKIFSSVTDMIDENKFVGLMSQYAYEKVCRTDFNRIKNVRCRNAQVLMDELQGFDFIQSKSGFGDIYVAVLISNRDAVQSKLASLGIFCTIIWPLNDEQREACEVAKFTEEHILTIYCDQRYTVEDMKYVASCIRRICNE